MGKLKWTPKPRYRSMLVDARKRKGFPHTCKGCIRPIFSNYRKYCDYCLSKIRISKSKFLS